jgi:maltooligosyltrehalose trehalohydrolase
MTLGAEDYRFGPAIDDDLVRFQLWAPQAGSVQVLINGTGPVPLELDVDGYWQGRCKGGAGTRYRFEVDGTTVPDPASRFQPQDVDGPSEVVDATSYSWRTKYWAGRPWEEAVIYEVHAGLCGGYDGVRKLLPNLAALGVTAVELMPIGDFAGTRNWGYDGVTPFAPDSAYGTPDSLRTLVDEAHGLGLMMFLDVVYNHFGPHGNYLPGYASQFFDEATPTPWGAAIDFHQPAVRRFFTENAHYWLSQFRFDGLRLDAVHAICDRTWLLEMAGEIRNAFPDRHVHLVLENEHNDAALLRAGFNAQWNDDFHNVMHVLLTGENHAYYRDFADRPAERLARCLSEGFIYQGEASPNLGGTRGQPSGDLPPASFVAFLQNHDQVGNRALGERLSSLASLGALRAAMALLLLSPQIPLLFMGEEHGAVDPFLFFTDFHGDLADAVRDGRRREFAHSPGFDDASARESIPDPNDPASFSVSVPRADAPGAREWNDYLRRLLKLRHDNIVPALRGAHALGAKAVGEKAVLASWQLRDGGLLTIACNLGQDDAMVAMPAGKPLFGDPPRGDVLPAEITLAWLLRS